MKNKIDLFSTDWHISHSKKFVWKLIKAGIKYLIVKPIVFLKDLLVSLIYCTVEIFDALTDLIFGTFDKLINSTIRYLFGLYLTYFNPFWLKEESKKAWFFYDTRQSVDGGETKVEKLIEIFEELKKKPRKYFVELIISRYSGPRMNADIPLDNYDLCLLWNLAYFYCIGYIEEPILETNKFETGIGPEFYVVHFNCDDYVPSESYTSADDDYYKRWKEFVEKDPRLEKERENIKELEDGGYLEIKST